MIGQDHPDSDQWGDRDGTVHGEPGSGPLWPAPTDPMAVARQYMARHVHDGVPLLRRWRGNWMRWQTTHWSEMEHDTVRADLYTALEHAEYEELDPKTDTIVQKRWKPNRHKVANVMQALCAITDLPDSINAPAWLSRDESRHPQFNAREIVSTTNGLLHVATRTLMDHTPTFFNLVSVPFDHEPDATCPRWTTFLNELWPDEPDAIHALQEYVGYVLSGRTDQQKILLMVGPTRSGKGTIARIKQQLIGPENTAGPTLSSLATNFGLSPLLGKPLAVVSDARLGGNNHQVVERLLTISGEDALTVDRKFREPWTGRLPTRFVILSNELPSFGDASGAIAHRFVVLVMARSWRGNENTTLTDELTDELPGILNWALDGLDRLTTQGRFTEPRSACCARRGTSATTCATRSPAWSRTTSTAR